MKKYHLLAPGPTPIPPEVLQALSRPILHHRTPEFETLFARVRAGLADMLETRSEVLVLAASGTGAMEAAVVTSSPRVTRRS
jgi:aspartate aminotransferase-like enzyme